MGNSSCTTCYAKNLVVATPWEIVESVAQNYANNDELHGLYFSAQSLQFFPKGIDRIFRNIKSIVLSDSDIKKITKEDLKPFNQLTGIWFSGLSIEVIEEDLFLYNKELTYVNLWSNKLQHIDANVFSQLTHLSGADFTRNTCINSKATTKAEVQALKIEFLEKCQNAEAVQRNAEDS